MLSVQDLHKSYQVGKTTYEVLKGVSLEVAKGEFVAVMGPSGSGKTTLLNCISCYIPADSGSIRLGSQELARLDEDMWTELFLDDADYLTTELDELIVHLREYADAIRARDAQALRALLRDGREKKASAGGN